MRHCYQIPWDYIEAFRSVGRGRTSPQRTSTSRHGAITRGSNSSRWHSCLMGEVSTPTDAWAELNAETCALGQGDRRKAGRAAAMSSLAALRWMGEFHPERLYL